MAVETQDGNWPSPKFYFAVRFGSPPREASFQEVSGLDVEEQAIEYSHGDRKQFSTMNMPGINKMGNITLKKGIFVNDNNFWNWYDAIKMNTIKRETITTQLLDETGSPAMTWILNNAWPTKMTTTNMKAEANEVAIETLELSHEGLTVKDG
ncbi:MULTISPECIES: phage tail protein [Aequorivita]|uniref:Phage tail protein n=1 Tax=Aequorivita iocasae TaxID=2803865 RepID=A0ABX7DSR0_9FLAO|nr:MULTISPECIES: phage tail protein [Aequorivita]QQX77195.1 phage tail protein [Aequorivita iocasae]UCA56682.1 phage tail protein [Aequorivita sp. F7]